MKVELKYPWFAPTDPDKKVVDKKGKLIVVTSGQYYTAGEHEMPDNLRDILPPGAQVLDGEKMVEKPKPKVDNTLRDFDEARSVGDIEELEKRFKSKKGK